MNEVAAAIPGKWRDMGLHLGLNHPVLARIASISPADDIQCYSNIFTEWKSQNSTTDPYTWSTIVQALESPAVRERRLADMIKSKLSGHPFTTTGGMGGELLAQTNSLHYTIISLALRCLAIISGAYSSLLDSNLSLKACILDEISLVPRPPSGLLPQCYYESQEWPIIGAHSSCE